MRRRQVCSARLSAALAGALACLAMSVPARAELPVVGYLAFGKPGAPTDCADALRRGLADLGLNEQRDYRFEIRYAMERESGLHEAARSLALEDPAVMVSGGINPILALRAAGPGRPLVSIGSGAMIEQGLIHSFARPGGSVTGISNGEQEHSLKALELLLQAFDDPPRVGLVMNRSNPAHASSLPALERLAASRRAAPVVAWVDATEGIDEAYAQFRADGVQHAVVLPDWVPSVRQHAQAALNNGIASIGFKPGYAAAGGLMNFSVRSREGCRRAAQHVGAILAGSNPAELPVEQLDDYELVISLSTLRKLGMILAPGFMSRADRVLD